MVSTCLLPPDRSASRQTDKPMDGWKDRGIDRAWDGQIDKQTNTPTYSDATSHKTGNLECNTCS